MSRRISIHMDDDTFYQTGSTTIGKYKKEKRDMGCSNCSYNPKVVTDTSYGTIYETHINFLMKMLQFFREEFFIILHLWRLNGGEVKNV